ncbi:DUF423 domain-containing protein [Verrucomicrobia bacterium LW23]|nr:DUF423 domain-containing protein [Verrucomicrobia bacterium LW23]
MSSQSLQAVACVLGFTAVVLGALGAHGPVHNIVLANNMLDRWQTAVFYHIVHAVVILVLARTAPSTLTLMSGLGPAACFLGGILLFSGSLYVMAYTGVKVLGAITPIGGLCFLAGWIWLAFTKPGV